MKKLLVMLCGLMLCACASSVYAFELERLELDAFVPAHLQKTDFSSTSRFAENLSASADFRLSLIGTKLGTFGIEGTPVYDIRNSNLDANFGVYFHPLNIKYLELHYDHSANVDIAHFSNISYKGNDIIGLRFIVKE